MADPLTENPLIASFFSADPGGPGLTLEQLKARRAIAAALAAKSRDYPNTVGKGIFSVGESIGEGIRDYQLNAAERRMRAGDAERYRPAGPGPAMEPPPPIGAPGAPAGTSAPPVPGSAELDPAVDLSRSQIAQALEAGAQGSRPAGPAPIQTASLGSVGTMSDAGQPGLTYGGPSPAGPGASMAEPPDQAPPTPSAPPPTMAGPGPSGTTAPQPVAGGGVPPQIDAARSGLAQQIARANQAFNPDATGSAGSAPGIPPQMVAQIGGFGGASFGGAPTPPSTPELPPQGNQPGPQYGPGGRPIIPQEFVPPTEADRAKLYGPRAKPPEAWPAADKLRYQQAIRESLDPYRSDEYKAVKRAEAEDIVKANQSRYTTAHEDYRLLDAEQKKQLDKLTDETRKQHAERSDPEFQGKRELAESNLRIIRKTGMPAEEVHKRMDAELKETEKAMRKQEDNQIILQAMREGIFTGAAAPMKLQLAKINAWLTNSEYARQKGVNTEYARSRLLSGISEQIKDLKPISQPETQIGKEASGADINLEEGTIKSIVLESIRRNNQQITKYDSDAQRIYGGERQAKQFESPRLDWADKAHVELLSRSAADPAMSQRRIQQFNDIYGPGSAETILNRVKLRGGRI